MVESQTEIDELQKAYELAKRAEMQKKSEKPESLCLAQKKIEP